MLRALAAAFAAALAALFDDLRQLGALGGGKNVEGLRRRGEHVRLQRSLSGGLLIEHGLRGGEVVRVLQERFGYRVESAADLLAVGLVLRFQLGEDAANLIDLSLAEVQLF